jgi:hypothetical protein
MHIARLKLAALAAIGGVSLAGCAYDTYGSPYGYGYAPYGGVSVGIGYGGYGGYYGGYGYGPYDYGYDPFGWYGDFYYPGAGIYIATNGAAINGATGRIGVRPGRAAPAVPGQARIGAAGITAAALPHRRPLRVAGVRGTSPRN